MSKYISVDLESRPIVEGSYQTIQCKKYKMESRFEQRFTSKMVDKLLRNEKNRIILKNEQVMIENSAKIRKKLTKYAKSIAFGVKELMQGKQKLQESDLPHSKTVSIDQKYSRPIVKQLKILKQIKDIQESKRISKSINDLKHLNINSPNAKKLQFLISKQNKISLPHSKQHSIISFAATTHYLYI